MADSYVQVAADGSGKKIRNLQASVVQPDGSLATVYMQVVSLADEAGNLLVPVSAREYEASESNVLAELQAIRQILSIAFNIEPERG